MPEPEFIAKKKIQGRRGSRPYQTQTLHHRPRRHGRSGVSTERRNLKKSGKVCGGLPTRRYGAAPRKPPESEFAEKTLVTDPGEIKGQDQPVEHRRL